MRQGWIIPLCAALALFPVAAPATHAAGKSATASQSSAPSSKSKRTYRQFTGVVTALDKSSITVEKSGKQPRTVVFDRHAEMKTTGDLEEDARVTVYYREDGGRSVAHKVVVKAPSNGGSKS